MQDISTQNNSGTPAQPASGSTDAGTSGTQVSDEKTGPIRINPTGEYLIGDTDQPLLGTEVLAQIGEAALKRKFQAEADKAAKRIAELEAVVQERDQLKAEIERQNRLKEIEEVFKEKAPASTETDSWYTDAAGTPAPGLTPEGIARTVGETAEEIAARVTSEQLQDLDARVKQQVAEIIAEREKQRESQQRLEETGRYLHEQRVKNYMDELGFSLEEATRISNIHAASQLELIKGKEAAVAGDTEAAIEHFKTADSLRNDALKRERDQAIQYEKEQARKAMESQLESGTFVDLPDLPQVTEEFEPNKPLTKLERRKLRQAKVKRAAAEQEALERIMGAVGSPG